MKKRSNKKQNSDPNFEKDIENAILNSWESTWKDTNTSAASPSSEPLLILPIVKRPLFPGMITSSITIDPGPYYDAIKAIMKQQNKQIGILFVRNENVKMNEATFEDLYKVGVLAEIIRIIPSEQGSVQVIFSIEKRILIKKTLHTTAPLSADVTVHKDNFELTDELKALSLCILSIVKEILPLNPIFKEELQILLSHFDYSDAGKLADLASAFTNSSNQALQEVLETLDVQERCFKSLLLLKKEHDITVLQHDLQKKVEAAVTKTQKDFFLREQLKTIKKELGIERDDKSLDRDKFAERIKNLTLPEAAAKTIKEEMDKLEILDPHAGEYGIVRNYLDWLTSIPWGVHSKDNHDLTQAESILEEDHFGLEDIKQRILEHIAVGTLIGEVRSTILCLVGPPGVGKTSIGKSVARALGRKFFRFSVGGMRDEAEIKGHRRTYIGALPGKVIQSLKATQTMNPVVMIDEIDKMTAGYHGDPASALLEVLDPEQNSDFLDHYLDVRCNLSGILFITTANTLDTIPDALKDRMEILRLSGYTTHEKSEIAHRYLIPKHKKEMGLQKNQVTFTKEAILKIINQYAREAGVRTLENEIKKILRKIALKLVHQKQDQPTLPSKYQISPKNLIPYLGKPKFFADRFYERTPIGVCTGLAWTAMGGATLYVESIKVKAEQTSMELTGHVGDVMKESSKIAWSYLHSAISQFAPSFTFFEKSQVHIHIPEGATPKDGPSAGITLVTSLLSLLTNIPVLTELGMTGELTLTGRILPVGGIKEKLVAAKRSGLKTIILPKDNKRDVEELSSHVTEDLTLHFVEHYSEVFSIAFGKNK